MWNPSVILALLSALLLAGCTDQPSLAEIRSRNDRDVARLLQQPTPERLAAAALLARWPGTSSDRSMQLIGQAQTLAPQRPELVWLQRGLCGPECPVQTQIDSHLQQLDPDNGFVWLGDLDRAQASGSEAAITAALERIGSGSRMTFYWNELEVMLTDGMAAAKRSTTPAERTLDVMGLLAGVDVPPLQPMSKACRPDRLAVPGRRTACERLFGRMEQSGTVLTQSLALSIQERWWPVGSPQRAALLSKHRRLDYLMATSSRLRWWHLNRDMALRLDAARRTGREEDVELALVRSFGLPTEPPTEWKDPYGRG